MLRYVKGQRDMVGLLSRTHYREAAKAALASQDVNVRNEFLRNVQFETLVDQLSGSLSTSHHILRYSLCVVIVVHIDYALCCSFALLHMRHICFCHSEEAVHQSKTIAFHLAQIVALCERGIELYTKSAISECFTSLAVFIHREESFKLHFAQLTQFAQRFVRLLDRVDVIKDSTGKLSLFAAKQGIRSNHRGNNCVDCVDEWSVLEQQCRGLVIDVQNEISCAYPLCHRALHSLPNWWRDFDVKFHDSMDSYDYSTNWSYRGNLISAFWYEGKVILALENRFLEVEEQFNPIIERLQQFRPVKRFTKAATHTFIYLRQNDAWHAIAERLPSNKLTF